MATFTGKIGTVMAGGVAIAEITNFSITITGETVDDTAKGDDWRTRKPTFKSWAGEAAMRWDPTDAGQGGVAVGSDLAFKFYPTTATTGEKVFEGNGIVTEKAINSELEGLVETTVTIEGNGELAENTVA